mgnify:CR=1 FL=1
MDDEKVIEMNLEAELQEVMNNYRSFWSKRFDISQKISMEKDLNEELKKAHFLEYEYDFTPNIQPNNKFDDIDVDLSVPLFKQIDMLEKQLQKRKHQLQQVARASKFGDPNTLLNQIESEKSGIHNLENDINLLLDKMVSYEDEELHLLRAQKQHYSLQRNQ